MTTILGMEIVEKLIAAVIERADIDGDLAARGYHLFAMKIAALEFRHGGVLIADDQFDLLAGRNRHFARVKLATLDRNDDIAFVGMRRQDAGAGQKRDTETETHRSKPRHFSSYPL